MLKVVQDHMLALTWLDDSWEAWMELMQDEAFIGLLNVFNDTLAKAKQCSSKGKGRAATSSA